MKKVLILLFAAALMVACTKSYEDKREHYINYLKSATKSLNDVKNEQDLQNVAQNMKSGAEALEKELTIEEHKKIMQDPEFKKAKEDFLYALFEAEARCYQN